MEALASQQGRWKDQGPRSWTQVGDSLIHDCEHPWHGRGGGDQITGPKWGFSGHHWKAEVSLAERFLAV